MALYKLDLSINTIHHGLKCAAALDERLCEEEWLRYYTFTQDWCPGLDRAGYSNGSGDHIFFFFLDGGAVIKGFDHESQVSLHARDDGKIWPGIYDGLPPKFGECLQDESALFEEVTFCYWKTKTDFEWQQGPIKFPDGEDDGAEGLLSDLPTSPEAYREWAQEYYEIELEISDIRSVYRTLS